MRHRRQQSAGVILRRLGEKLCHSRDLDDLAGVHDDDPVGQVGDHPHVVGDQHDGAAQPIPQVAQQFQDFGLHRDIQRGGRLVGEDHLRVAGDSAGDDHALLLPAGQLMRIEAVPLFGIG